MKLEYNFYYGCTGDSVGALFLYPEMRASAVVQELVRRCVIEGWSYTEVAAQEGKDESAIRHAVKRALKKTFF